MGIISLKKITENIKEYVKLLYIFPTYRRYMCEIRSYKGKRVFLIGTPAHGNLGDHAIAISEISLMNRGLKNKKLYEIPMPFYKVYDKWLKENIRNDDVIVISGGGWMGNLWIHNEITIRNIVKEFLNNRIVIFPQTLHYTIDEDGRYVANVTKEVLSQHKNLFLAVRDLNSYNSAIQLLDFDTKHLLFCPDMVLEGCLKYCKNKVENNVLICLRSDVEQLIDTTDVKECLKRKGYYVEETTTVLGKLIKMSEREELVRNQIKKFSEAQFMVTDRLHAMIFALLSGTPCYVFNNSTGKVFGIARYLIENGLPVEMINSLTELEECKFESNAREYGLSDSMQSYFTNLLDCVNDNESESLI